MVISSKFLAEPEKLYPALRVAHKYASVDDIGDAELALYRNQGFLAVECVLNPAELRDAVQAIEDITYGKVTGAKLNYDFDYANMYGLDHAQTYKSAADLTTPELREMALRKISDYVDVDARLAAIRHHPKIISIVEKITGEKTKLLQDMAILKPPGGGGGAEKPWHQDMAYGPLCYDRPVVGVWIALDEATVENGCMHVIPGSHADGGVPHYAVRDWQMCDTSVPVHRDMVVPLKPGGVLVFHGMLVHGTPPNQSKMRRRALQFHLVGESAEKVSPKEYKRIYTNEMSGAEC
jgi:phytanoyl-CoA hydroxylase